MQKLRNIQQRENAQDLQNRQEVQEKKMKLWTAGALFAAAGTALAAASFAWFTIISKPELNQLMAHVTVNGNLEIALGLDVPPNETTVHDGDIGDLKERNRTWGNLIDLDPEQYPILQDMMLQPLSRTDEGYGVPIYGSDGRVNSINYVQLDTEETEDDCISVIRLEGYESSVAMFAVSMWLRANTEGNVVLITEPGVARAEGSPETEGKGTGLVFDQDGVGEAASQAYDDGKTPVDTLSKSVHVVFLDDSNNELAVAAPDENGVMSFTDDSRPYVYTIDSTNKDTPIHVRMCVFLDGAQVSNAEMCRDMKELKAAINVQLGMDNELHPMEEPLVN